MSVAMANTAIALFAAALLIGMPVFGILFVLFGNNERSDQLASCRQEPSGCGALLLVIIVIVLASMIGGAF